MRLFGKVKEAITEASRPESIVDNFRNAGNMSRLRKDGMMNSRTKIGTSKDNRMVTVIEPNIEDETLYEALYDASAVAKKIVDIFPKDATREWIELINLEKTDKGQVLKEMKRLNLREKIYQTLRYSRLYGAGLLFIADGTPMDGWKRPINSKNKIQNLILFSNYNVQPSIEKEIDINSPHFGMPLYYSIISGEDNTTRVQGFEIHHSRFIIIQGDDISRTAFIDNGYFNYGVLGKLQSVIKDWEISHDFIPDIISKYNLLVVKIAGMAEILQQDIDEGGDCKTGSLIIQEKMDELMQNVSSLNVGAIDAEDDMEIKNPNNISGLKDLLESMSKNLIMKSDIPHTRLMGESPVGSNATGNSTTLDWYDKIRQYQDAKIRTPLDNILTMISNNLRIVDFDFIFLPLWQQTAKETAETKKLNAETDAMYIEDGVVSSEEIRASRFAGEVYSGDTTIDKDIKEFPKARRETAKSAKESTKEGTKESANKSGE